MMWIPVGQLLATLEDLAPLPCLDFSRLQRGRPFRRQLIAAALGSDDCEWEGGPVLADP